MIKIFFLLMIISYPDQPSVNYNGFIYPTEAECVKAKDEYNEAYAIKEEEYKKKLLTEAFCIPFEIKGMKKPVGA
jgi:hypothetical protein